MDSISSSPRMIWPPDKKIQKRVIDYIQLDFSSDQDGDELLDTEVRIKPQFACECLLVIAGKDIDNFTRDFHKLVKKYRI